jgi:Ni,Fe-hydrogenase III small subunit
MEDIPAANPELFGAPPQPTTIKEALQQIRETVQLKDSFCQMEDIPAANPEMFGAPPQPTTIKEALQQRLDKARDTKKEN